MGLSAKTLPQEFVWRIFEIIFRAKLLKSLEGLLNIDVSELTPGFRQGGVWPAARNPPSTRIKARMT